MNAVVYARYSSHRQGEQSIEGQLHAAHEYARTHSITIIHEYIDRAQTGRNDDRVEFQRMLQDSAKKQFELIILWKIDRFGRNREEIAINKHRCKKNGVRIISIAENIPDSPEGVILESVLEGMAEYYSLQLSQNIRRGLRETALKGKVTGGNVALGLKIGPDKDYEIDPDTAPIVRTIFEMYAGGVNMAEIIRHLNKQGVRTSRGAAFNKNSLRTILKNPKYIGTYIYNDIELEDRIPAIIDKALFDRVQKMLKHNQKNPTPHCEWADYILAGKAFCGLCGDPMTGVSGRGRHGGKYHYYKCNRRKQKNACTKSNVQKQWIEDTVIDLTVQKVLTPGMIEFIAESTWQYYLSQREDNTYLTSLTAQLAGVEKSIANLIKAIEMGIVNESTKARMDELEAQKQSLKAAIAETKLGSFEITKEHILFFLKQFVEGDIHDEKYRQRIVDTFINSVFVYDDKIVTTYNYSGDNRTLTISDLQNATDGGGFVCRAVCSTTSIITD